MPGDLMASINKASLTAPPVGRTRRSSGISMPIAPRAGAHAAGDECCGKASIPLTRAELLVSAGPSRVINQQARIGNRLRAESYPGVVGVPIPRSGRLPVPPSTGSR